MTPPRRWLFADQLGPHFLDDGQHALLVEARSVFRRRRYHRRKAHLVLSALHHRAQELGDRAVLLQTETYGEALSELGEPVEARIGHLTDGAMGLDTALPCRHARSGDGVEKRGLACSIGSQKTKDFSCFYPETNAIYRPLGSVKFG